MTMSRSAIFSEDGKYRYSLTRIWDRDRPRLRWIMLNPSIANDSRDSATITRVIQYSEDLGFGSCVVYNLFALVSQNPSKLISHPDPVGTHNDRYLKQCLINAKDDGNPVMVAWGNRARARRLLDLQPLFLRFRDAGVRFCCLGITQQMQPMHPLGLNSDSEPFMVEWTW